MNRIVVQIYSLTDPETARAVAQLGADHVGFVAGVYGLVPNEVDWETARRIAAALPSYTAAVALTMATDVEEILRMAAYVRPDIVHISTGPYDVDLPALTELRRRLPRSMRLMKAIPVACPEPASAAGAAGSRQAPAGSAEAQAGAEEALALARRFVEVADILLLDSKAPGLPGVGATGRTHDWRISRCVVAEVGRPVILAGGLSPENVAEAIRAVRPWGVDSFTGTNIPGTTRKDLARVAAFIAAARQAGAGDLRGGGDAGQGGAVLVSAG